MLDVLYLAWRYLAYHRLKTIILICTVAVIVFLPLGLNILVVESGNELTNRARSTPLVLGAKGSPLELVLRSLYFESDVPADIRYAEIYRVDDSKLATAIPLHLKYRTRRSPIVGTSLEYFDFRELQFDQGRTFAMLGECVLGARAASSNRVGVGGSVVSATENLFDLAGVYPLKMKVVGVLAPTGTPDDDAVFVDVKTAWVIAGLAHGHADLSQPDESDGVLRRENGKIIANSSVVQYNEITPENAASFHFHGDPKQFPITSVVCIPHDEKSAAVLRGRYLGDDEQVQVIRPDVIIDELLATVLTVRRYVLLAVAMLGLATLATMTMVFLLSWQLRRRELETIVKIGGSRPRILMLLAAEVLVVLFAGCLLASVLTAVTYAISGYATEWLIRLT